MRYTIVLDWDSEVWGIAFSFLLMRGLRAMRCHFSLASSDVPGSFTSLSTFSPLLFGRSAVLSKKIDNSFALWFFLTELWRSHCNFRRVGCEFNFCSLATSAVSLQEETTGVGPKFLKSWGLRDGCEDSFQEGCWYLNNSFDYTRTRSLKCFVIRYSLWWWK